MRPLHREAHRIDRSGWIRAAVLGANDGLISTASLLVGVAAASPSRSAVLVAGIAGLVAGAMSMAAGEYVSVSSQSDIEKADIRREQRELVEHPETELSELTHIYIQRGVEPELAGQVAQQMMAKDAFAAHARDELGLSEYLAPRPLQAAWTSAAMFSVGAAFPLVVVLIAPSHGMTWTVAVTSLIGLGALGGIGAWVGGADVLKPTLRVTFWGAVAMGITALVGMLVGTVL